MKETKFSAYSIPGIVRVMVHIPNEQETIISEVVSTFGVTMHQIESATRKREVVVARQVLAWCLRTYSMKYFERNLSCSMVGRIIGNRDHATVLHSCKVVEETWMSDRILGYGTVICALVRRLDDHFNSKIRDLYDTQTNTAS